jgi:hypothetical protein
VVDNQLAFKNWVDLFDLSHWFIVCLISLDTITSPNQSLY